MFIHVGVCVCDFGCVCVILFIVFTVAQFRNKSPSLSRWLLGSASLSKSPMVVISVARVCSACCSCLTRVLVLGGDCGVGELGGSLTSCRKTFVSALVCCW